MKKGHFRSFLSEKRDETFSELKEAVVSTEKKLEKSELDLAESKRKYRDLEQKHLELKMKEVEKPETQNVSTNAELDQNKESSESTLRRYAVEDTLRLEEELRKEKESKHKMQSSLSKRIHTLTKQLEALRSKSSKTVIKDFRSREDTPPRAVQMNAYKILENTRRRKSETRQSPSKKKISVYRHQGRRSSIAIDDPTSPNQLQAAPISSSDVSTWLQCNHPSGSRRSLKSKTNHSYDFCNICKAVIKTWRSADKVRP